MRPAMEQATGFSRSDLETSLRFLARVPAFLRHPFSDGEARALVRGRVAVREAAFLDVVRRAVYEQADSHPAFDPLDEGAICDAFLESIAGLSPAGRVTALRSRAEGLPRVERRPPLTTDTGKILHVHQQGGLTVSDADSGAGGSGRL